METTQRRGWRAPAGEEEWLPGAAHGLELVAARVQVGRLLKLGVLAVQQVGEHAAVVVLQQHLR